MVLDSTNPIIEVKDVSFRYDLRNSAETLSSINFSVQKGEWVAIIGNNGSGKSTLVGILLGLYKPQFGSVTIFEEKTGVSLPKICLSAAEKEVAAGAESENMLLYLISSLRRSNEPKPAWFIKDVAIEELQKKFGLEAAVASEIFEDLKAELFKALDIEVPVVKKMSEEELNEKKKEIERLLSSV